MNHIYLCGIGVAILSVILITTVMKHKDKFVYDPMSDTPNVKVSLADKPKLSAFFDAVSDGKNSFTDKRYKMNCAGCVNNPDKTYFKPVTPRNCIFCHDFVNGKTIKLTDKSNGVL